MPGRVCNQSQRGPFKTFQSFNRYAEPALSVAEGFKPFNRQRANTRRMG